MKIVILGSTGFLGSNLKFFFIKNDIDGDFFFCDSINILRENELNEYIEKTNPDIIINCCGIVGSSEMNKNLDEDEMFNKNFILNMNILNCCKKYNIKRLITFSSYRMFGENINDFYNEEDIHSIYKINHNAGYLLSKKLLDIQIQLFKKKHITEIVCLILPNVFGCFDNFDINGRILPALITKIEKAKNKNEDLYLNTNANNTMNLIYVEDVFNIVNSCLTNDVSGNIIIFNKNGTYKLKEITEKLKGIFDYKKNIIFSEETETRSNIMNPDISKFNYFFENYKFHDIENALEIIKQLQFETRLY